MHALHITITVKLTVAMPNPFQHPSHTDVVGRSVSGLHLLEGPRHAAPVPLPHRQNSHTGTGEQQSTGERHWVAGAGGRT